MSDESLVLVLVTEEDNMSGRFRAHIEGTQVHMRSTSRQPRLDGARELLALGYPPETLMTTRAWDSPHMSFFPEYIGVLAEQTMCERDKGGIQRAPYQAMPEGVKRCRGASQDSQVSA